MNRKSHVSEFWKRTAWIALSGGLLTVTAAELAMSDDAASRSTGRVRHVGPASLVAAATLATPARVESPVERGRVLFVRQCAICHGETGDGAGRFGYLMNPPPRNFRKGKFKLTTTANLIPSDDDLVRTITRGMPGSAMPPWGHLPESDRRALAAYVRSLHVGAVRAQIEQDVREGLIKPNEAAELLAERTQPGPALVIPPEPPFDDMAWFSGRRVYVEACAACHGLDGHPNPAEVKFDDEGYPDPPRSFVNGIFKGGMDGPSLYARVLKGMRGTPMPAYEGTYSNDEMWALIHYVQSLARQGSQDRAQLRQGTITAAKLEALPSGPDDPQWGRAAPLYVAMTPLWWSESRIEGAVVQAAHDGRELALRLMWLDKTQDDRAVRVDEFRDGAAVQFALATDPPFYMGDAQDRGGVNIWMWKSDREKNIAGGYQDVDNVYPQRAVDMYDECPIRWQDMANVDWPHGDIGQHNPQFITAWGAGNLVADPTLTTPVECLVAHGPGTLSGKPANVQVVQGASKYDRGVWTVQMRRALDLPHAHGEADERVFKSGDYLPISIAIWDGGAGDRDGKKNISIWQKLVVE